jgi:hypothetical protein
MNQNYIYPTANNEVFPMYKLNDIKANGGGLNLGNR